jgi:hypothetical protein
MTEEKKPTAEKKPLAKKAVSKKPTNKTLNHQKTHFIKAIWRKLDGIGLSGKVILILVIIGILARLFEKL